MHFKNRKIIIRIQRICFLVLLVLSITAIPVFAGELTPLIGESEVNQERMLQYYEENSPTAYPQEYLDKNVNLEDFVDTVIDEAGQEGIRADVAFAQIIVETEWLIFNGQVALEQNNFGQLKNEEGEYISFKSIQEGIRANVKHLKSLVTKGEITNVEDLEKGQVIKDILRQMKNSEDTEEPLVESYITISFDTQGGSTIDPITVDHGSLIKDIPEPTKEGYIFLGWYKDSKYTNKWDIETEKVLEDILLYAKWEKESNKEISNIKLMLESLTIAEANALMDDCHVIEITTNILNVRQDPDKTSTLLDKTHSGEHYLVLDESNGWYQIVTNNGKTGWVNGIYTKRLDYREDDLQSMSISYIEIDTGTLNVRQDSDNTSTLLDKTRRGERYLILGEASNGWYQIRTKNGVKGWINGRYTKAINHVKVATGTLNVRERANNTSELVDRIRRDEIYEIEGRSNGWYRITTKNGVRGWISGNYVKEIQRHIKDIQSLPLSYLKVDTGTLNVRSKSNASGILLDKVRRDEIYFINDELDGWYKIRTRNGQTGWVSGNYVDVLGYVEVTTGTLNVRSGPGASNRLVDKIHRGETYLVADEQNGWYQIKTRSGKKGWINGIYTRNVATHQISDLPKAVQNTTDTYIEVTTNVLNVRSGSNASHDLIDKTYRGQVYLVEDEKDNWYKIRTKDDVIGWVSGSYTKEVKYTEDHFISMPIEFAQVTTSTLNVRLGSSSSSQLIDKIHRGEIYMIEETASNGWHRIRTIKGIQGWVSGSYVNIVDGQSNDLRHNNLYTTQYNVTLEEALAMQMKVGPQTDKKYAYVSATYIDNRGRVTASALNVRSGPSASKKKVGSLSQGETVDIISEVDGWYQISYSGAGWVDAARADVRYYLNSDNFVNDERQRFQFLDLSKNAGISASVLNSILSDKGVLKGTGSAFIEASIKHNVNEIYLVSHALLETGNGTSELATGVAYNGKTVYNVFGIGAVDRNPIGEGAKRAYEEGWDSVEKAIIGGADWIARRYINNPDYKQDTLYKMRWNPENMENDQKASHQYATDIAWAYKQVSRIKQLYDSCSGYTLYFDIPSYK